jgi:hypothetical protein
MSGETDAFYINVCQVCAITNNCPTVTKDISLFRNWLWNLSIVRWIQSCRCQYTEETFYNTHRPKTTYVSLYQTNTLKGTSLIRPNLRYYWAVSLKRGHPSNTSSVTHSWSSFDTLHSSVKLNSYENRCFKFLPELISV